MNLLFSSNTTLHEIVTVVEAQPKKAQARVLRQAKLERAKITGAKITEAQKKVKIKVTDNEIARLVNGRLKKKNPADAVFGIWKNEVVTIDQIRKKSWQRTK